MNYFKSARTSFWPVAIFFIALVVCFANYFPGTFLTGWDTLHPEFNFQKQFENILFGVWREDQGLGAVAAHAHISEIPRVIFLWLSSFVFPLETLRYLYIFLCFILGPLGCYFFCLKAFEEKNYAREGAFLASTFYIFNLGTLQHFYVPFEMFPTQYAALGWLFLFATKYFLDGLKRYLIIFGLISFFSASMAYAPLLWYAYFLGLCLFLISLIVQSSKRSIVVRRGVQLIVVTLLTNLFWLLPNWYFALTHAKDVPLAKINQMFSERAFLSNKQFGNLVDVVIFKSFLFDWDHAVGRESVDLMLSWKQHLNPITQAIGYIAFSAALGGVVIAVKSRNKLILGLVPIMLMTIVMIVNMNPPFEWLFRIIRELSPILRESLRFPFTKFSILLMFCMSVFFGSFWQWAFNKSSSLKVLVVPILLALCLYCLPMFQGNLIDPQLRIRIPDEYRQTFEWLNEQENGRVANLPMPSLYGWEYYDWGYQGAGFLWFGIKQPVLARDFDRWMPANENYYWESSYALYSKNLPLFEKVVEKYRIKWLIVDENVINPISPKALFFDEINELLGRSEKFQLMAKYGGVNIYSVRLNRPTREFVSVASQLTSAGPPYKWGNLDKAFEELGDYKEGEDVTYNRRTVFTGKRQEDLEFDPFYITTTGPTQMFDISRECFEDSGKTTDCITVRLPELNQDQAYLTTVESRNIEGVPLVFWVENLNARRADIETYLPQKEELVKSYHIIPPMAADARGYSIHLDSVSVGKERALNEIGKITIAPISYSSLISGKIGEGKSISYLSTDYFKVLHPNPSWYQINLQTTPVLGNLVLAQSFEEGWVAWDQDFRFLKHNKVNNWANGWELSGSEKTVYIFFWPQLLEFIGFGLLGGLVLVYTVKVWAKRKSGF